MLFLPLGPSCAQCTSSRCSHARSAPSAQIRAGSLHSYNFPFHMKIYPSNYVASFFLKLHRKIVWDIASLLNVFTSTKQSFLRQITFFRRNEMLNPYFLHHVESFFLNFNTWRFFFGSHIGALIRVSLICDSVHSYIDACIYNVYARELIIAFAQSSRRASLPQAPRFFLLFFMYTPHILGGICTKYCWDVSVRYTEEKRKSTSQLRRIPCVCSFSFFLPMS